MSADRTPHPGLPGDRIARGWAARLVGGVRRRFVVLLVVLAALSLVPWGVSMSVRSHLDGFAEDVDLAGSLRYRHLAIAREARVVAGVAGRTRSRLDTLLDEQRRAMGHLISRCPSPGVCQRLGDHLNRLEGVYAPALAGVVAGTDPAIDLEPFVEEELLRLDDTVHTLAAEVQRDVDSVASSSTLVSWGAILLLTFLAYGVWEMFERIRRLRAAADAGSAERVGEYGRVGDEIGALARVLEGALRRSGTRSDADRARVETLRVQAAWVRRFGGELQRWLIGSTTLQQALQRLSDGLSWPALWLDAPPGWEQESIMVGEQGAALEAADVPARARREVTATDAASPVDAELPLATLSISDSLVALVAPWSGSRAESIGILGAAVPPAVSEAPEARELIASLARCLALSWEARALAEDRRLTGDLATMLSELSSFETGARGFAGSLRKLVPHQVTLVSVGLGDASPAQTWRIDDGGSRLLPVPCRLAANDGPVVLSGAQLDACQSCAAAHRDEMSSALVLPLEVAGRPLGVVVLADGVFSDHHLSLARSLAPQLSATFARFLMARRLAASDQLADLGRAGRDLAHHLRNPVNTILLHMQVFARRVSKWELGSDEKNVVARHLDVLHAEMERLGILIRNYEEQVGPSQPPASANEAQGRPGPAVVG